MAAILLVFIVAAAGSMIYYAFSYKYSQMREGMMFERRSIEDMVGEEESLTIIYVLLNVSESRSNPPLYLVLGTGLRPPLIGAIYVNGSMVYNGSMKLPPASIMVVRIPTFLEIPRGSLIDVEIASASGVKYSATGYAG